MTEGPEERKALSEADQKALIDSIKAFGGASPANQASFTVETPVKVALFKLIASRVDSR